MSEKLLQDALDKWLRSERIPFRRDRMDMATSGTVGWPDFSLVLSGRVLLIETKFGKGTLSKAQKSLIDFMAATGTKVHVIRDLPAAIELVQAWRSTLGQVFAVDTPKTPTTIYGGFRYDVVDGQLVNRRPI